MMVAAFVSVCLLACGGSREFGEKKTLDCLSSVEDLGLRKKNHIVLTMLVGIYPMSLKNKTLLCVCLLTTA